MNHWVEEESGVAKLVTAAVNAFDWSAAQVAKPSIAHESEEADRDPGTNWLYIFVRGGTGKQSELGNLNAHRYTGVIILWVCVPEGNGTGQAKIIAGVLDDALRSKQFTVGTQNVITCSTPYLIPQGAKKGVYRLDVTIPFRRDKRF